MVSSRWRGVQFAAGPFAHPGFARSVGGQVPRLTFARRERAGALTSEVRSHR
jgi:hypothetical protein